jgi:hypothetical protein
MTFNTHPNKTTALALNQKAAEGVTKYFAAGSSLLIDGTTYTPASLTAVLEAETDSSLAVDAARAHLAALVATHRRAKASARTLRMKLRGYILASYGTGAVQMLGDFGMTAPKPLGRRPAQVKADAVAKANATRRARSGKSAPPGAQAPSPA